MENAAVVFYFQTVLNGLDILVHDLRHAFDSPSLGKFNGEVIDVPERVSEVNRPNAVRMLKEMLLGSAEKTGREQRAVSRRRAPASYLQVKLRDQWIVAV